MNRSFVRVAPWLILLLLAYAVGRWQGRPSSANAVASAPAAHQERLAAPATESHSNGNSPAVAGPSREQRLATELEQLHAAARTMASPDARTYAYFENLQLDDLPAVTAQVRAMPPGNEQDLFFAMVIRRWAQLDAPAALAAAATFPALAARQNAELGAWEAWATYDAPAAMARARSGEPGRIRDRQLAAILIGASTRDPREALELWQSTPEDFRNTPAGPATLEQIVTGACGTGKRDTMVEMIETMAPGETRDRLAAALCAEWGGHYPDEALLWLNKALPESEGRVVAMSRIFESLVQKDPSLAATWGAEFPDTQRRPAMIASAISSWVEVNPTEAELWINEQADSPELDGATFAMAAHYIGAKNMPKAFAWIRRIRRDEARSELLGNLGRAWSKDRPAEFRQFIDQTSLNRAELDSLLSKIDPAADANG